MSAQQKGGAGSIQQQAHEIQDLEIKERLAHIKNKILVMSGKGGVGKSSVAAYLAVGLARRGFKVGLMDVDLHGPSIPRMLGLQGTIGEGSRSGKAKPVQYMPNMEVISIETLLGDDKDVATIWRGPLKIGVIRQFISDLEWMDLDYMVIDSPPGTGDEPLTVAQTIPDAKALIVTTPQEVSLADVRKSIHFCRQVKMDILGLVENMSGLKCPHCGEVIPLFMEHGGMLTAKREGLRFLASLPIEPQVVLNGDSGKMMVLDQPDLPYAQAFNKMVDQIVELMPAGGQTSAAQQAGGESGRAAAAEDNRKIVVVPVIEGKLSAHFGHSEQFAFVLTEGGKIVNMDLRTPPPHQPGVIPQWLHDQGANVVIAGGLGEMAQQALREKDIEVIVGAPMGTAESLVNQYLADALVTGANVCDH